MSSFNDFNTVMRAWGRENDLAGSTGGWIRNTRTLRTFGQGWYTVYRQYHTAILDWVTQKETAFDSFRQMVEETGDTYRPTLWQTNAFRRWLSDEYDRAQTLRNDPRRVYRAGSRG